MRDSGEEKGQIALFKLLNHYAKKLDGEDGMNRLLSL